MSPVCTHQRVCSSSPRLTPPSDLHAAAVHLDNLGSEGLDGSQDQLLVLQGRDAKTQHIPVQTQIKGFQVDKMMSLNEEL